MNIGFGIDLDDALLGYGKHSTRPTAGIIDSTDDVVLLQRFSVLGKQEIDHQADDLPRREVLTGVLVQRLVESPNKLFKDETHLMVGYLIGMKVDVFKPLHDEKKETGLLRLNASRISSAMLQIKLACSLKLFIVDRSGQTQ